MREGRVYHTGAYICLPCFFICLPHVVLAFERMLKIREYLLLVISYYLQDIDNVAKYALQVVWSRVTKATPCFQTRFAQANVDERQTSFRLRMMDLGMIHCAYRICTKNQYVLLCSSLAVLDNKVL